MAVIPAVIVGHGNILFSNMSMSNQFHAGTLRCLMKMGTQRDKNLPNIPTSAKKGFPKVSSFQVMAVKA